MASFADRRLRTVQPIQPSGRRRDPFSLVGAYRHRPEDNDKTAAGTWRQDAACTGQPSTVMFPEPEHYPAPGELAAAKFRALALCSGCPVTAECLAYAIQYNETAGVWGGTLPRTRRRIRARARQLADAVHVDAATAAALARLVAEEVTAA